MCDLGITHHAASSSIPISDSIVAMNGFSSYAQFKDNAGVESHISTVFLLVSPADNLCIQWNMSRPDWNQVSQGRRGGSRPNYKKARTTFFYVFWSFTYCTEGVHWFWDFNENYNFPRVQGIQLFPGVAGPIACFQ